MAGSLADLAWSWSNISTLEAIGTKEFINSKTDGRYRSLWSYDINIQRTMERRLKRFR